MPSPWTAVVDEEFVTVVLAREPRLELGLRGEPVSEDLLDFLSTMDSDSDRARPSLPLPRELLR
jgi:hypothetical protein